MFSELFTYITTPCPQYVRNMNYLNEAIDMRGRYRRNLGAWQPHLDRSRRFVLSSAEGCRNRGKAVVLGAGLLLDVPLDELSSLFNDVVLVDIVFLPEIRKRIKKYGNVRAVLHDVTNTAERLYGSIQRGFSDLPESAPAVPEIDTNTGLVVSLNILSQLWVIPRAYALAKLRGLDEELMDDWCGQLVKAHYAYLQSLPCNVCLVADYQFVKQDRTGSVASRGSTVFDLALPEPDDSWAWAIVPMAGERQYLAKELHVGAWHLRQK